MLLQMVIQTRFKGDTKDNLVDLTITKDNLLEGHLYGGLRKDLHAFEHPLKGLQLKGLTINVGPRDQPWRERREGP